MEISKKLLSEVLNESVERIIDEENIFHSNIVKYINNDMALEEINIHELTYNLEMWAYLKYNIRLIVWFDEITSYCEIYNANGYDGSEVGTLIKTIDNQCSKQDIVIKACEWILKETK